MTDAERIAVYLKTTVRDIERCLSEPAHQASSIHVRELAAMLSDVRREEREACLRDVERELDGAKHRRTTSLRVGGNVIHVQLADAQIDALGWAIKRIKVRGIE